MTIQQVEIGLGSQEHDDRLRQPELHLARSNPKLLSQLDFINQLGGNIASQNYVHHQGIFTEGDKADSLFYIYSGHVKLTVTAISGKKAIIAILHSGDFFGEGCLIRGSRRLATATSVQPSTLGRVERIALSRTIHSEPRFAKHFISQLLARIAKVEGGFADQIFSSSEKRLARILVSMAGFGDQPDPEPATLKVSQETLSEMVGTTRSRVSYFMNRFRKLGLIDYNGSLQVNPSLITFLAAE